MDSPLPDLPDDLDALRAVAAAALARNADDAATIARQSLEIAKLRRQIYGPRSERTARLVEQMELELEELEAAATEDEIAAERAAARTSNVAPFTRNRPSRQSFPEHLPRERVVIPAPVTCNCCGGTRLRQLGETITETLEVIPRQWKVIQHVREKMTCRDCETISEPPAPFHVTPRGCVTIVSVFAAISTVPLSIVSGSPFPISFIVPLIAYAYVAFYGARGHNIGRKNPTA